MKLLITIIVLIFPYGIFALTEEENALEDEFAKECINKTGANPAVVGGMKNGDFSTKDENTKCYAKCMLEKAGILDSAGNFNVTVAKKIMVTGDNKVRIEATIDECKHIKGECPCDTAFKLFECYYTKNLE